MNPKCAACDKTVYPVEKLNCLDKCWHKGCFRCSECGMSLNMKNYKGYNKFPYCAAHYPTTKFTAVADTPENLRLKQNTTNQSSLVYHKEFEKMKGTYQPIADDLETRRATKSAHIASEISYRGIKGQREEQEMHRPEQVIGDERRNPRHRAVGKISDYDPAETHPSPYSARSQMPTIYDSNKGGRVAEEVSGGRKVGKISDYDPDHNQWGTISQGYEERVPGRFEPINQYNPSQPASQPGQQPQQPPQLHTWQPPSLQRKQQQQQQQQPVPQQAYSYGMQPNFGQQGYNSSKQDSVHIILNVIDDKGMYQPPPPSGQQGYRPPPNQPISPSWNPQPAPGYGQIFNNPGRDPQQPWPSRQVPQQYKNSGQGQWQQQRGQGQTSGFHQVQPAPPQNDSYMPPPPAAPKSAGPGYRAMYDYTAADDDEISFVEGDIIKEVTVIDDGWMEGRNTRTGNYGMLPSNYVERV